LESVDKLSPEGLSAEAKRILEGHQDYDSYSQSKFTQYFQAGQQYLEQGKYYRAVDAYTLASIYKPGPTGSLRQREAVGLVYAGKSMALFAAGEYMSSALFLSRAIDVLGLSILNCQFSLPKDELNKRIADAEECLRVCRKAGYETSSVGELQFLLGYIYLRTGRLSEAKTAIDEAYKMLPDNARVRVLKQVLDQAR
jgi:tetratricopeptide (TPR) repeat protein